MSEPRTRIYVIAVKRSGTPHYGETYLWASKSYPKIEDFVDELKIRKKDSCLVTAPKLTRTIKENL